MNNVVAIKQEGEAEAERIEFGGVVWTGRADEYKAYRAGQGRFNALDDYLADLRAILLKLDPGSDYAKGYSDGQAELAAKLQAEIDSVLAK